MIRVLRVEALFLSLIIFLQCSCSNCEPVTPPGLVHASPPPFHKDWVDQPCPVDSGNCPPATSRLAGRCPYCPALDDVFLTCSTNRETESCGGAFIDWDYRWMPCIVRPLLSSEPWRDFLGDVSSYSLDGSEVLVVAYWSGGYCRAWNGPHDAKFTFHVVSPPSAFATYQGFFPEKSYDDYTQSEIDLMTECTSALAAFDPSRLEVTTTTGHFVDLDICDARGVCLPVDNFNCDLDKTRPQGVLSDNGGSSAPMHFDFPGPADFSERGRSTVVPQCPFCASIDALFNPRGGHNLADLRYYFGYFPVALLPAIDPHTQREPDISPLSQIGMWETGSSLSSYCYSSELECPWPCEGIDANWFCDYGDYAILVGKWMAPFCEGWGLPSGILRHHINLKTGEVRLFSWYPFTEQFYDQPWAWDGISSDISGYNIFVASGTTTNCGITLDDSIKIGWQNTSEFSVNLPLMP